MHIKKQSMYFFWASEAVANGTLRGDFTALIERGRRKCVVMAENRLFTSSKHTHTHTRTSARAASPNQPSDCTTEAKHKRIDVRYERDPLDTERQDKAGWPEVWVHTNSVLGPDSALCSTRSAGESKTASVCACGAERAALEWVLRFRQAKPLGRSRTGNRPRPAIFSLVTFYWPLCLCPFFFVLFAAFISPAMPAC